MIIYPTPDMSITEWADQMIFLVGSDTAYERLDNPEMWQIWAMNFVGEPDQTGQDAPDPFQFDDWREWAQRLFYTVEFRG